MRESETLSTEILNHQNCKGGRSMDLSKIKISIFLFLAIPASLFAQLNEFEIRSLKAPEFIPVFLRYPDEAVLIIFSPISDLKFESNFKAGIVDQRNTPDEAKYELFIKPQKQIITVRAPGYRDGDIIIVSINAKESRFYSIEPKRKPISTDRGDFTLNSIPSGATFKIDGLGVNGMTPYRSRDKFPDDLLAATFVVRVSKENYETKEDTLIIEKAKTTTKTIVLTPKFGYVTVDTRHTDAILSINGALRTFQSGNPIEVTVGELSIKLKKQYYHDFVTKVRVDPNDDPKESIPIHIELTHEVGWLVVNTTPSNAKAYLDAEDLGNTPLKQKVNAGKYTLEVRKDNYRKEQATIEVLNNQTTTESIKLYQNGIINIEGTQGTAVYINDKYEGTIPIKSKIMEQGQHRIRLQKGGYDTEEATFTVKTEERTLTYNLVKTKWRAFRWTGRGNERISSILTSLSLSAGYFKLPGTSTNLVKSLLILAIPPFPAREEKTDVHLNDIQGLATDVSVFFPPLTFTFGLGLPAEQPGLVVTNRGLVFYGNANWTPFVLYEVLYPSIGINYTSGVFEYRVLGKETIDKLKYTSWGRHYELRISTYNKKGDGFFGGFFLKFGYADYFDNKSGLEKLLYINGGVWWGSQRHQ
jgi:hypothetical protein